MKIIQGTCKFCGIPLSLKIDDAYANLERDPLNLILLACCNRCGDARVNKRKAQAIIQRICEHICDLVPRNEDGIPLTPKAASKLTELKQRYSTPMLTVTKKYAIAHADVIQSQEYLWTEDFSELLLDNPHKWGIILSKYDRDCYNHRKTI